MTTGSMHAARLGAAMTLLPSGKVLASLGIGSAGNVLASAELYDPSSGDWRTTGATLTARSDHQQQLLADGMVLAFSGYPGLATAELYNPATARWTPTASMNLGRESAGSVLFGDGRFLIAGRFAFNPTATAEIYTP